MDKEDIVDWDVVIVGAGISGIAAARALSLHSKLKWIMLEASNKVGGRIQATEIAGTTVDLGAYQLACFQQSQPRTNSLYQLIKSGYCNLNNRTPYNKIYYYTQTGTQYTTSTIQKIQDLVDKLGELTQQWCQEQDGLSVAQCYHRFQGQGYLEGLSQQERMLYELKMELMEHEEAASPSDLAAATFFGVEEMEVDEIDGYPLPDISYAGLVQKLASELPQNIQLQSKVTKIQHSNGTFKVYSSEKTGEKIYKSKFVISAVPLPVIKKKQIVFEPELPQSHSFIFDNLGFGHMQKVILAFEQAFWPTDAQRFKISSLQRGKYPHFSNISTPSSNIICCYITSTYCKSLLQAHTDTQIIAQAVEYLKQVFPDHAHTMKLKQGVVTRWINQKFIEGSFSYIRPKLKFQVARTVRHPVWERLFFVGEFCYPENIGCAHGAYQTGWLAAEGVMGRVGGKF